MRHRSDGRKTAGGPAQSRSAAGGGAARNLDGATAAVGDNRAPIDFQYLKQHVSIPRVLERYGLELHKLGHQHCSVCPIHGGSDPRQFVVRLDAGTWFCFGDCDRGGSVIDIVALKEGVSIPDAARILADWFAIGPPTLLPHRPHQQRSVSVNNGKPSHKVFVVENRDDSDAEQQGGFWTHIGSAWPHKDGKGLNLLLKPGIAVSGRVVLREWTDDDQRAKGKPSEGG